MNVSITDKIKHLCILQKVFRSMYFIHGFYPVFSQKNILVCIISERLTIRVCTEELIIIVKSKYLVQVSCRRHLASCRNGVIISFTSFLLS